MCLQGGFRGPGRATRTPCLRYWTILLCATFCLPVLAASSIPPSFTGDAYDRDGRLLYRETHEFAGSEGHVRQLTTYRDGSGRIIGRMEADYSTYRFSPQYLMQDYRHRTEETVRRDGASVLVTLRNQQRVKSRTLTVRPGRELLVGPGFDGYIRANWDRLVSGEVIKCDYVVPNRMQIVGFEIARRSRAKTAAGIRFKIEVDNALVRLLAPSLELEYDSHTRRVLTYEGPSNVNDTRDRQQEVVIAFPTQPSSSLSSPPR